MKFLHKNGAKANVKNSKGETPIITAALRGHRSIVKYLYQHGAGFQGKKIQTPHSRRVKSRMSEDHPM